MEADVVEAPGATALGTIGVGMCISIVVTVVVLDLATIHRHFAFMKRNISFWLHRNGWIEEDPNSKKKSRKQSSKRFQRSSKGQENHVEPSSVEADCDPNINIPLSTIPSSNHPDVSFKRRDTENLHASSHFAPRRQPRLLRIPVEQNILSPSDLNIQIKDDDRCLPYQKLPKYNIREHDSFSNLESNINCGEWKHYGCCDKNINENEINEQTATQL